MRRSHRTRIKLGRRTFIRLSAGAAATLAAACGDDGGGAGGGTAGSTGSGSTATGTTRPGGSTDGSGSQGGSTGTTGSSTGGSTGTSGTTGGAGCEPDAYEIAFDPETIPEDGTIFPLAVMAGEMKPTSVLLSTIVDEPGPVRLKVFRPADDPGSVWMVYEADVTPNADGYLKVPVEDLCPGTWYRYGFFTGDPDAPSGRSVLGEFRTALADDDLEPLTVAMTACTFTGGPWPALQVMSDEYYDMVLQLGDQLYNDDVFDGPATLQDFRNNWRLQLSQPDYKKFYSRAGLYVTWDDHEVTDNGKFNRETTDPVAVQKRDNALDAFFELMPVEGGGRPNVKLWRSFRWGKTAEIIVLDCRYERKPSEGIYISPEQMAFLKERLLSSPCHFKVVMNSVPITNMPLPWDVAASDRWEGFPAQRDELRDFINANDIRNVWWVSGDFHVCFVAKVESDGNDRWSNQYEIACSAGNENPAGWTLFGSQFDYGVGTYRGCIITFDPMSDAVHVRFLDPDGGDDYNKALTQP